MDKAFALHETMEVLELLTFKNVCMTKAVTMPVLVSDPELKELLATTAATDRRHISELKGLLDGASIMTEHQGVAEA